MPSNSKLSAKIRTNMLYESLGEKGSTRASDIFESCLSDLPRNKVLVYLDVGTGSGQNANAFSKCAQTTIGLDLNIPKNNALFQSKSNSLVKGDGMNSPFPDKIVDVVTLISVLEHVPNQLALLKEIDRLLKKNGLLIIQIPNRFFMIELHSGIPFFFYFPKTIRQILTKGFGCRWLDDIDIPTTKKLSYLINKANPNVKLTIRNINYSPSVVNSLLQPIYSIILRSGLLNVNPMGYLLIVRK